MQWILSLPAQQALNNCGLCANVCFRLLVPQYKSLAACLCEHCVPRTCHMPISFGTACHMPISFGTACHMPILVLPYTFWYKRQTYSWGFEATSCG